MNVLKNFCIKLVICKSYTKRHGQRNIKRCLIGSLYSLTLVLGIQSRRSLETGICFTFLRHLLFCLIDLVFGKVVFLSYVIVYCM
jgi:hypothetical protein